MMGELMRLTSEVAYLTRVDRDQVEFEKRLDRRRKIKNGLRLARRYRSFYRATCNFSTIEMQSLAQAFAFKTGLIVYMGIDPIKTQIVYRWLCHNSWFFDTEIRYSSDGTVKLVW